MEIPISVDSGGGGAAALSSPAQTRSSVYLAGRCSMASGVSAQRFVAATAISGAYAFDPPFHDDVARCRRSAVRDAREATRAICRRPREYNPEDLRKPALMPRRAERRRVKRTANSGCIFLLLLIVPGHWVATGRCSAADHGCHGPWRATKCARRLHFTREEDPRL